MIGNLIKFNFFMTIAFKIFLMKIVSQCIAGAHPAKSYNKSISMQLYHCHEHT